MTDSGNDPDSGKPDHKTPGGEGESDERNSISSSFLKRLGEHDEQAWRRLAELYGPVVLHWCRLARLQAGDADDVLQEVFRTVAQRVAGFDLQRDGGTFRGWLWSITRHKLGDFIRSRRKQGAGVGGSDHQQWLTEVAGDTAGEGDASTPPRPSGLYERCFDLIRAEFEDRSWQAFWRTAVEGQPAADVAAALGTSANAVYLAKSRILRRLREELGEE